MRRRTFTTGAIGLLALPVVAAAQSARPLGKIGYVHPTTVSPTHVTFAILQREWRRLGYVEGETVLPRSAENDPRRLPAAVAELVAQRVAAIIVVGAAAVRAAAAATKAVPIVAIDLETDPVRSGLVASYARPGGNVTGLFLDVPALAGKWIELLREAAPSIERIAFAWDPATGTDQLDIALAVARRIGIESVVMEFNITDDLELAVARLGGGKKTGIVQLTFPGGSTVAARFAAAANKHGLPTISFLRVNARSGMLMTYGPSQEEYFPRAVAIADKIVRGEKVGEIPIERPVRFELAVNLNTAKALGLNIPPSIFVLADELIE